MQLEQGAPWLDYLGKPGNLALTQLVAAGAAQQQGGDVGLFDAQFAGQKGQVIAHRALLQLQFSGAAIQLMQFEPHLFRR